MAREAGSATMEPEVSVGTAVLEDGESPKTAGVAVARDIEVEAPEQKTEAENGSEAEATEQPKRGWFGRRKKQEKDEETEYEVEFETPFGKLEFEFEPTSRRKKKQEERKRKQQELKAAEAARKAQEQLRKQREKAMKRGGGMSKILLFLFVAGLIIAAVGVAYWLFARKPEELDQIPDDLRAETPSTEPRSRMARVRERVRKAVRAGQRASSEAQREQQRRYEEMAGRA